MPSSPSVIDLGKKVKEKFPGAYDSMPDDVLGRQVKTKFPGAYDQFVDVLPSQATVPGMEKLGGTAPGPVKPPDITRLPLTMIDAAAPMAYEAKYGMPAPPNLGHGFPGVGPEALPGVAVGLMTGPGAFLTSAGAGYGASRGLKALGLPEVASDIGGALVSLGTGHLYGRFGLMPKSLSPSATKLLDALPGSKNYGTAFNEYLGSFHPPEPPPVKPFTPGAATKRNMPAYGGPPEEGFSPPGTIIPRGNWEPTQVPTPPPAAEPKVEPFKASKTTGSRMKYGGPPEPEYGPAPARKASDWEVPDKPLVPTPAPPPEPQVQGRFTKSTKTQQLLNRGGRSASSGAGMPKSSGGRSGSRSGGRYKPQGMPKGPLDESAFPEGTKFVTDDNGVTRAITPAMAEAEVTNRASKVATQSNTGLPDFDWETKYPNETEQKLYQNRNWHALTKEMDLPGSPPGTKLSASPTAREVFGKEWMELTPRQQHAMTSFTVANKRPPTAADVQSGLFKP